MDDQLKEKVRVNIIRILTTSRGLRSSIKQYEVLPEDQHFLQVGLEVGLLRLEIQVENCGSIRVYHAQPGLLLALPTSAR